MQYEIKEIELQNKNKIRPRLIITFADSNYELLGEWLMVDAPLFNWHVLDKIQKVLANEKEKFQSSGNRTSITITKDKTIIEDLLASIVDDGDLLATVVLDTVEFQGVLLQWYKAYTHFQSRLKL